MKTSELTGPALDWAVAKCEGHVWRAPWLLEKEGYKRWQGYEAAWGNPTPPYSTDWSQGGPIIERERIGPDAALETFGQAFLAAALRTYVSAKLGEEVNIPDELKD